jgi:hypothetical protein
MPEDSPLKVLWSFEDETKLRQFAAILDEHGIFYEIRAKTEKKTPSKGVSLSVYEDDYEKAKKLLLKHRKRRTSSDFA